MWRDITIALLLLNGIWDVTCVALMLIFGACIDADAEDCGPPHWALWERPSDRANPAARFLFGALVCLWGVARLMAASCMQQQPRCDMVLIAMWTYTLEGVFLSCAAAMGHMRVGRALCASALCVPMLTLLCIIHL